MAALHAAGPVFNCQRNRIPNGASCGSICELQSFTVTFPNGGNRQKRLNIYIYRPVVNDLMD